MRGANPIALTCLALVMVFSGCGTRKAVVQPDARTLAPKGVNELLPSIPGHSTSIPRYYSAKADIAYSSGGNSKNFKAQVRMVWDSAAWMSAVPVLGIEVARAMLTPDSLMFMDKLHDTYWKGDSSQARQRFGVQPSLDLIQEALLGRAIGLDPNDKYRSDREEGMYTLTTKEKRRFLRAAEDISPADTLPNDRDMREKKLERTLRKAAKREAMVYKYWIDPDSMRVNRVSITDLAHDRQAEVHYADWTTIDGHVLPAQLELYLSAPGQRAVASMRLDHIQLNGPLNLPFRIPEKFKPMD